MQHQAKELVMLCAHEPDLDPRIDWAATLASEYHVVTVLGIDEPSRPKPRIEQKGPYEVVRLPPRVTRGLAIALQMILPRWLFWTGCGLFLLFWPLFMLMAVSLRLTRSCWRGIRSLVKTVPVAAQLGQWLVRSRMKKQYEKGGCRHFLSMVSHFLRMSCTLCAGLGVQKRPGIVHCNDLDSLLVGVWAKKVYGCTLVYDAHELYPFSDVRQPWYGQMFFRYYEKLLVRQVDHVFTVTPMLADIMKSIYRLERVGSVPNSSPIEQRANRPILPAISIAPSAIRFLFQGHFCAERGLEELIRVWARIDPRKGVMLLRGPLSPYHIYCQQLAQQLGTFNRQVFFLPAVSEAELIPAARQAHVGVIPYRPVNLNYKYCCPNKLSQFMQANLAIVANNLPFVREIISKSQCGLTYDSNDEESMLAAFTRMIEDDAFREKCRENALAFARSEFHWEVQSRPMREMYEKLSSACA